MRHTPKLAAASVAGMATVAALGAGPAFAAGTLTVPNPYPMPQSAPGVIDSLAVDITGTGFTPGTFLYAQYCDGLPGSSSLWAPSTDCGPAEGEFRVQANGKISFPGTDPNFAILVWHGDLANNKGFGEQPFNCLAPDDNPHSTLTTQGAQPIDPNEPAWGSQRGKSAGGGGPAPCQIRITSSLSSYSPSDIFLPVNLAASGHYLGGSGATLAGQSVGGGTGSGGGSGGASAAGAAGAGTAGSAGSGSAGSGSGGSAGSGANSSGSDPAHSSSGGLLASTGADVGLGVVIGLAAIAGGTLLVRRARRRRAEVA